MITPETCWFVISGKLYMTKTIAADGESARYSSTLVCLALSSMNGASFTS